MPRESLDDPAADLLVADSREGTERDRTAELIGDRGQHTWDRFASSGERGRIGAVRVCDAADPGHVPVDVAVGGRVAGRGELPVDQLAEEIADDDRLWRHGVEGDAARLDHHQLLTGDTAERFPLVHTTSPCFGSSAWRSQTSLRSSRIASFTATARGLPGRGRRRACIIVPRPKMSWRPE